MCEFSDCLLAWAVSLSGRGFLIAGLMQLASCSGLEQLSSGHVGCAPDEITVSQHNTSLVGRTWTAQCRGQEYFCSTNGGGDGANAVVACTVAAGPPGGAGAVPAPPQAIGCSYDTQCKGERICEEGVCTAAPEPYPKPSEPGRQREEDPPGTENLPRENLSTGEAPPGTHVADPERG